MDTQNVTLTRSPYEILKISRWAGEEEIKSHYFHLVKQYNPEYFPDEFIEIRTAYDLLKDPQKKAKSDVELFAPPPEYSYTDYPNIREHPLSLFKLNQELKTICGDAEPEDLEGEARDKVLHILRGAALYHVLHNNKEEARNLWNRILEMNPEDEETKRNMAFAQWEEAYELASHEKYAEAEEKFASLADSGAEHGIIYHNLALCREKQGKKVEAEEAWHKSLDFYNQELKSDPDNDYLKALIVNIHKYTGGKFIEGSSKSMNEGSSAGSAKELGYACIQKGNWRQAVDALEQAQRESPNDVDVLCQLGWAYLNTNQQAKAFHMWNLAMKKSPGKRQIIDHLVRGYIIFGKRLKEQRIFNQALVQFKNALKYEPENVEIRLHLADTYFQMRNFAAALQEYNKILEQDPRNKNAKQGVRESRRLGGLR